MSVPAPIIRQLFAAAMDKHICAGKPEAIWQRLEWFAQDLFPSANTFFSVLFGAEAVPSPETTPRRLGETFWNTAGLSREEKRALGSFYTPERVIDRILDLVWKDIFPNRTVQRTVCDPALGCGFFLLRLVERRLEQVGMAATREWAQHCLFGVDLDPDAVFMARASLWLALSDHKTEFVPDSSHFRLGDALLGPAFDQTISALPPAAIDWARDFPRVAEAGGFNVIIGNPPYEVLTNFSKKPDRAELAASLRDSGLYTEALSGQINLYRCFIERSLDLLAPGGVLSFIVPLSLTRDAAALPLRTRLVEQCATRQWQLYGERDAVFPGVTQSACIFRAIKDGGKADTLALQSQGETVSLKTAVLRQTTGESFCFPHLQKDALHLWLQVWENTAARLGDICTMRVGDVDQTFYRNCMADEDTGCLLARGMHVVPFHLDVRPLPGKERFLREEMFLEMKGANAATCRERANQWRVVQLGIRNMHSLPRLVAAIAQPGVYLGNSLNAYVPMEGISLEYLAGLLNSSLLDWLFRATSGNNNINLHEMRRLPIPDHPQREQIAAVETAYRACAAIVESGGDLEHARIALDKAIAACYGLGQDWQQLAALLR